MEEEGGSLLLVLGLLDTLVLSFSSSPILGRGWGMIIRHVYVSVFFLFGLIFLRVVRTACT